MTAPDLSDDARLILTAPIVYLANTGFMWQADADIGIALRGLRDA